MFSFHRPKVYRSSTGCCICKAKSSSSRFTDSKRYEEDFLECFKLSTPRQGEICNACVLLVKRWKKLPAGSDRNWQHVVDARAGPGMKSMTKFKSKNKKIDVAEKLKKKKRFEREFSPVLSDKSDDVDMGDVDFMSEEVPSGGSSRTASPGGSDYEDAVEKNRRHKGQVKRRENNIPLISDFIDLDYWKEEHICCGTIFKGLNNEIMLDHSFLKPCNGRRNRFLCISQHSDNVVKTNDTNEIAANVNSTASKVVAIGGSSNNTNITNAIEPDSTVSKLYSDSSSDSGYDESSNQGTIVSLDNNNLHGHHHHLHHHQQHLHHHLHHYNNKTEQVSIGEIKSQIPKINN